MHRLGIGIALLAAAATFTHFMAAAWQTLALGSFADTPIFVENVLQFLHSGTLYDTTADLEVAYGPTASVYKFPPAYALGYLPWISSNGIPENLYSSLWALHIFRYLLTMLLCIFYFGPSRNVYWWSISIVVFCGFSPFYEALHGLTFDNLLLFCFCICLLLIGGKSEKYTLVLVGFLGLNKIYPAVQLLYYGSRWRARNYFFWLACPSLLLGLLAIAFFGLDNNLFYYSEIFPVLLQENISDVPNNMSLIAQWSTMTNLPLGVFQCIMLISSFAAIIHCARQEMQTKFVAKLLFIFLLPLQLLLLKNYWGNYQMLMLLPVIFLLGSSYHHHCRWPWTYRLIALLAAAPQLASVNYSILDLSYLKYAMQHHAVYAAMIKLRHYSPLVLWAGSGLLLWMETGRPAVSGLEKKPDLPMPPH